GPALVPAVPRRLPLAGAPLAFPVLCGTLQDQLEAGGLELDPLCRRERERATGQTELALVAGEFDAAVEAGEREHRQVLAEPGARAIERKIRRQRVAAASIGVEPGLQRALAFQAEGQVDPGPPVAQHRVPELDVQPAGEALRSQRVDAAQLAAQAHALAERGRQPCLEREARRTRAPVEAELHLLELERRRSAHLVRPGEARTMDEDLALRE